MPPAPLLPPALPPDQLAPLTTLARMVTRAAVELIFAGGVPLGFRLDFCRYGIMAAHAAAVGGTATGNGDGNGDPFKRRSRTQAQDTCHGRVEARRRGRVEARRRGRVEARRHGRPDGAGGIDLAAKPGGMAAKLAASMALAA
eukprot:gene15633-biopygen1147